MLGADDEHDSILYLHIGRSSMASGPACHKNDEACAVRAQMHIDDYRYLFSSWF